MKIIYILLLSHFIGDYVLQSDFVAKTKGENWWHLIVHCALYTVPFALSFGINGRLVGLFVSHIIIDALKARWHTISYGADQLLHIFAMIIYLM